MNNLYNNLQIDIEKAHNEIDSGLMKCSDSENYLSFTDRVVYGLGHYDKLINSGIKNSWFKEFNEYWSKALGGRPLQFHDFFYLYSNYRTKFQAVAVSENSNKNEFIQAWQEYRNIYLIFSATYKYALHPFSYRALKFIKQHKSCRILEYGCGVAPIVTSMIKNKQKNYNYSIADIRNFTYHYAKYRLKQHAVKFIDIVPYEFPELDNYDLVFLNTVLEHLPDPIEVVKNISDSIKSGGHLIFDYILSSGHGLDTIESLEQRSKVLDYISDKFIIEFGKIEHKKSMGNTVVEKEINSSKNLTLDSNYNMFNKFF